MFKKIIFGMLCVSLVASCGNDVDVDGKDDVLVMGFVPSRDVNEIQLSANKIAEYLTVKLERPVKAITLQSYSAIVFGLANETVDFAFVGPLDYVMSNNKTGAYPITASVRHGKKGYRGITIVRKDSGINNLKDLKGKTVAFGDPLSASSNLYPKKYLMEKGIDPERDLRSVHISSSTAIVLAVESGKVDAGFVYEGARLNPRIQETFPDIMDITDVIYTSELIPADPQIVRKDLDLKVVDGLRVALLSLSESNEGKKWLADLFAIDRLEPALDEDYDILRDVIHTVKPDLISDHKS